MDRLISRRIKAATLVETIISLLVILIVFGLATSILVQVTTKGASTQTIKAHELLNNYAIGTREQKAFISGEITVEDYVIRKTVSDYKENNKLKQIDYYIYNGAGQLLDNYQEIVMNE